MISVDNKINNTVDIKYNHHIQTIPDSGCTKHYLKQDNHLPLHSSSTKIHVQIPNGDILHSSQSTYLPINGISKPAQQAHILPTLQTGNLLSIAQLCDDNCKVEFEKTKVTVRKNREIVLQGTRDIQNNLWKIDLPIPTNQANFIIPYKPIGDCIRFLHGACYSPCIDTWCKAIDRGYFKTWPGLTSSRVRRHLKTPEATSKGHLNQERRNLRSTKQPYINQNTANMNDSRPLHHNSSDLHDNRNAKQSKNNKI